VRSRLRFRSALRVAFTVPIMIPGVLIGVSLLSFFSNVLNLQLTTQTAVIGQSIYTTPYVLLIVAARLEGFDRGLERAASDLGANAFQRFRRIVLPLIGPAIFAGSLFAFTMSLDEFVITYFIIGAQITLPIYIYTQIKFGITPAINAVATILIVGSLGIAAVGGGVPRLMRMVSRWVQRLLRARRARPADAGLT
jgi:ABC-type spermidine/putrescine transport system permease subunit II